MNAGALAKKLKLSDTKPAINDALKALLKEKSIRSVAENKYVLDKSNLRAAPTGIKKQTYSGTVDMIKSGAAYIIVDALDKDVYVPAPYLNGAIDKDEVEVQVTFLKRKNPEGKVRKVIKRNTPQIIGQLSMRKKGAIVKSSSCKVNLDVYVTKQNLGEAKDGDYVLVDITDWSQKDNNNIVYGKVSKVLSRDDEHNFTMESILVENGFSTSYPEAVMKELDQFSDLITEEEIAKRRDFREILTITIDPDTAKDFDDAISYRKLDNGHTEVGVHIADVTHYVRPKTALDKEASNRSTSVYLVDRCIAMLPEKLSNELCSLNPKVDRLVFSAVFTFDNKYKIVDEWFGKSVIHSDHRFTYEEAQESIENKDGLYHKELKDINTIAKKLRKQKFKNGAIAFESDEVKFILDDNNVPTGVYVKERKDAHLLIEDFMLLANRRVAHYLATKNKGVPIPAVYRIHDMPDLDRLMDLALFMQDFDYKLDLSTPRKIADSFNQLSKLSKEDDKYKLLMQLAIRTMSKAEYSTNNIGHYGLSFEHYSHFTSPIRRYADVLVHRILEKNLSEEYRMDKNKLEAQCIHISKQERRAMEAERDSIKYKQVEYMSAHIGEEYDGIISGMIDKGIFVEISETKAEGLIPFDEMGGSYTVESGRYKATSSKKSLQIGDKIRVKVISTDLENRTIELKPVK